MLKKILIGLVVVVAGLAVVIAFQPPTFRVSRSATIAVDPPRFRQVNDFHGWEAWSPWLNLDPAAKMTYEGRPAGTGAIFKMAGTARSGRGA